ncbi:hypothetical protein, partial [Amycolatopsis kentuckyensis]|uniref:hypothetical protein n=1 Tax=Amycolatopsis kentuckyensis TaxID=218823 RepID=UPI001FCA28AD
MIALGELYEYLFDRVRERNPKQTPSRDIEMQGELSEASVAPSNAYSIEFDAVMTARPRPPRKLSRTFAS